MLTRVFVLILCAASLGACQQATTSSSAPAKAASPDAWATVNGRDIPRGIVEKAYQSSLDPSAPPMSADQVLTAKLNIVDEIITQEVLLDRAKALGVAATDAEVETALGQRKGDLADDAFQQQLKARGLTLQDFKDGIRRELTVQKVIDKDVAPKATVGDQDIEAYYNANRAQFNLREPQYRLAQIVVAVGRNPQLRNRMNDDAVTPDDVQRKVKMLLDKLKAGGDFGAIAMDYSEDPQSAGLAGDLGFVPASALAKVAPQLRDAVLKMQPGNVSTVSLGPAVTILALISREPAGQRELSSPTVRDSIRDMLQSQRLELVRTAYIAAARADAAVANKIGRAHV